MPYARLDDRWDDHRKIKRAWRRSPAAVGLHAMAITYCNRHNTDGVVDGEWIDEKLQLLSNRASQREQVLVTLVDLGLFESDGDDYRVHDFLDWNLSRGQRESLAEQGRRGGRARSRGSSPPDGDGSSQGSSQGLSGGSSTPRHATPTPRQEEESASPTARQTARVDFLCRRLADHITRNDAKAAAKPDSERWRRDMRLLLRDRDGDTAEIERVIDWCQADSFWRSNILSPGKLRQQFTQLVLKAAPAGSGNVVAIAPSITTKNRFRDAPEYREGRAG